MPIVITGVPRVLGVQAETGARGVPEVALAGFSGLEAIHGSKHEATFLWDTARDLLEDIATLRLLRAPRKGELWRDTVRTEERLLRKVEGVLSCGPVVACRMAESLEVTEIPDSDLDFAVLLTLACADWTGTLTLLERTARTAALRSPEEADAVTEALCFGPHPGIGTIVQPWLRSDSPVLRAVAVRTLSYRGELDPLVLPMLFGAEAPEVRCAAAEAALYLKVEHVVNGLLELRDCPEEPVAKAALRSVLRHNLPFLSTWASEFCRDGRSEFGLASLCLALSGCSADLPLLEQAMESCGPVSIRAAGYYGHVEFVPRLIDLLKGDEPAIKLHAATALERITGAGLIQTLVQPLYEPGDEEFMQKAPAPVAQAVLSTEPAAWEQWWRENRSAFHPDCRYRNGERFSATALVQDLTTGLGDMEHRATVALELAMLCGSDVPIVRTTDFVGQQEKSLELVDLWVQKHEPLCRTSGWVN